MNKKKSREGSFFLLLAIGYWLFWYPLADLYLVGRADTAKHSHLALRYLFALFCRQKCVGAGHRAKKLVADSTKTYSRH